MDMENYVSKGRLVAVESGLKEVTEEYGSQIDVLCHIFPKVSCSTQNPRQQQEEHTLLGTESYVSKGRLGAVESGLKEMTEEYGLQTVVLCHIFSKVS